MTSVRDYVNRCKKKKGNDAVPYSTVTLWTIVLVTFLITSINFALTIRNEVNARKYENEMNRQMKKMLKDF